ncbi:MAG: hypothetical protein ABEJ30_04995 [Halorientalis sp.]
MTVEGGGTEDRESGKETRATGANERVPSSSQAPDAAGGGSYPRNDPAVDHAGSDFDWRGWVLVGVVVLAFLVAPGLLYLLPTVRGAVEALGLGFRNTYLVVPLVPALLLGVVAVWSAVRSRAG